jgi:phospholipid N-methyltransferase
MHIKRNRIFIKSAATDFKRTGAVAPSSKTLGHAMAGEMIRCHKGPARVLEVGGGTGSITEVIAKEIRPGDHLDVYEIDSGFSDVLNRRLKEDRSFRHVRSSIHVHNMPIETIDRHERYDFIISCLPFTCFQPAIVREIFEIYRSILNPGGICSFFEYIFVRRAARFVSGKAAERRRVAEVAQVVAEYVDRYSYKHDIVLRNIPPAIVYHICFKAL